MKRHFKSNNKTLPESRLTKQNIAQPGASTSGIWSLITCTVLGSSEVYKLRNYLAKKPYSITVPGACADKLVNYAQAMSIQSARFQYLMSADHFRTTPRPPDS